MKENNSWQHFFSKLSYSAPLVAEWINIDRSDDLYWNEYERALNTYILSQDKHQSLALRYVNLNKSNQQFYKLKLIGDNNIATQLALLCTYIDLNQTENAAKEARSLIDKIEKNSDIKVNRPYLLPFPEKSILTNNFNCWLKENIKNSIKYGCKKTSVQIKTSKEQPLLSICIPTFNRAEKLYDCIFRLKEQFKCADFDYEIFVSDNHSTDNTEDVVKKFSDVKYIKRSQNYGSANNALFALKNASGKYLCYLSDDDSIKLDVVLKIVSKMEKFSGIGVCYTPACIYDPCDKKVISAFGSKKLDVLIMRGQQKQLLDYILETHAYPEVGIYRSHIFHKAFVETNDVAYEAFVWPSEILEYSDVAFVSESHYYWHVPEKSESLNIGHINAMENWDKFRGGLDVILSKVINDLTDLEKQKYILLTHKHAASMLSLAIRLRYQTKFGSSKNLYFLSKRLIGMGYENMLPIPIYEIEQMRLTNTPAPL